MRRFITRLYCQGEVYTAWMRVTVVEIKKEKKKKICQGLVINWMEVKVERVKKESAMTSRYFAWETNLKVHQDRELWRKTKFGGKMLGTPVLDMVRFGHDEKYVRATMWYVKEEIGFMSLGLSRNFCTWKCRFGSHQHRQRN